MESALLPALIDGSLTACLSTRSALPFSKYLILYAYRRGAYCQLTRRVNGETVDLPHFSKSAVSISYGGSQSVLGLLLSSPSLWVHSSS